MSVRRREVRILDKFLSPRAVGIVGLSRSAVDAPISVLTTLKDFGYDGRVYIVNPSMERADGSNVFASLADVPEPVDLAVISVERSRVAAALRDCGRKGIGAAIVITQGFADADEEGARLQDEIVALARKLGIRILGPNTIGVANSLAKFTSSFIELKCDRAPVGQVAQSGLFMMGHHLVNNEPAGYCMAVDLGNGCDIDLVDVLEYYGSDERIRVIECHTEGIKDGRAFLEAAARVSRQKPIVILKAGTSRAGRAAVASHTGAIAGESEVYRAAFQAAGVIQAEDSEELRLLSKAFVAYAPPRGRRVAIMSFSGGGAILAIDAIERAGLALAALSETTKAKLRHLFPPWIEVENPVDVWIAVARDFQNAFPLVLETLLQDEFVDAVICIYCSYRMPKYALYDSSTFIGPIAGRNPTKPVLCWSYGLDIEGITKAVEKEGTAMVFPSLGSAATTLAKLADYGEFRTRSGRSQKPRTSDAADLRIAAIVSRSIAAQHGHLFIEGLEILEACGLKVAKWRLVRSEEELVRAARLLAFPLCLKIVSPEVIHKSDSGGVKLGIVSDEALVAGFRELRNLMPPLLEDASSSGVLVQEMASSGTEVMIGGMQDPAFGPTVVFGAGGIYTEILGDHAFRVAPVEDSEAYEMVEQTKIAGILGGARGQSPRDLPGLVDALVKVSRLIDTHRAIRELDINPLIVSATDAVVVDARIIL